MHSHCECRDMFFLGRMCRLCRPKERPYNSVCAFFAAFPFARRILYKSLATPNMWIAAYCPENNETPTGNQKETAKNALLGIAHARYGYGDYTAMVLFGDETCEELSRKNITKNDITEHFFLMHVSALHKSAQVHKCKKCSEIMEPNENGNYYRYCSYDCECRNFPPGGKGVCAVTTSI